MINYIYGYMLIQNGADVMIDRKLEIFRMAATLGSFTGAAAALGMSQPNVTHQLAQLEADLGVELFIRLTMRKRSGVQSVMQRQNCDILPWVEL